MYRILFDLNIIVYFKTVNGHFRYKERPITIDDKGYYFNYSKKTKVYLTPYNCVNYQEIIKRRNNYV